MFRIVNLTPQLESSEENNNKWDCKQTITSTKTYQYFFNHTDRLDKAIRFLRTDLNSLICLLEIDQDTFFKLCSKTPTHFV